MSMSYIDPNQNPDLNIIGTRRVAELNGKRAYEKLIEYSESQHMYAYHLDQVDKGITFDCCWNQSI
jgi:hypothetical protein